MGGYLDWGGRNGPRVTGIMLRFPFRGFWEYQRSEGKSTRLQGNSAIAGKNLKGLFFQEERKGFCNWRGGKKHPFSRYERFRREEANKEEREIDASSKD